MDENNDMYASCCICLEDLDVLHSTTYLPCGHRFHILCINNFLMYQIRHRNVPRCPLCNATIEVVFQQNASQNAAQNTLHNGRSIRQRSIESVAYILLALFLIAMFIFILFSNL